MSQAYDSIVEAALSLPDDVRADLADRLLESLPPERQIEIEAAWAKECERRSQAFHEGRLKGIPADEVFREIQERLNR